MAAKHQKSHRIVLSPLIFATNTLVAEFLYEQGCHFCLSVLATEVPYKNSIPDFEQSSKFRFNDIELKEIFEAVGVSAKLSDEITAIYVNPAPNQINTSLLFSILKIMFKKISVPQTITYSQKSSQTAVDNRIDKCLCEKRNQVDDVTEKYFKQFSAYLEILSEHIMKLTNNIKDYPKKIEKSGKFNKLNQSLERISEDLKLISQSDKSNMNIGTIVEKITRLTEEIERCSVTFEKCIDLFKISNKTVNSLKEKTIEVENHSSNYSDWLWKFKASKYGQKFVASIEAKHKLEIQKENENMRRVYESKLEQNRLMLKLYYKQKMIEKCRGALSQTTTNNNGYIQTILDSIDTKLQQHHNDVRSFFFYISMRSFITFCRF